MSGAVVLPGAKSVTITQGYEGAGIGQHHGIDLGAPAGSTIAATHGGTVVRADYDTNLPSHGWHVRIQNGSALFIYSHMRAGSIAVKKGQKVTQGTKLGEVGSTGTSTGNHLHYEVREGGKVVNPTKYILGLQAPPGGDMGAAPQNPFRPLPDPLGPIGDAAGGVLTGIDALGGFFGTLGQRATWIRVLQVVGGAALVIGGVVIVGKGVIADVAVSALPGGGALKAMTK